MRSIILLNAWLPMSEGDCSELTRFADGRSCRGGKFNLRHTPVQTDPAEALAEFATHALDFIRKARDARRIAAIAAANPSGSRENDGFGRD